MNDAIRVLAVYIKDLLSYDKNLIKFGRANEEWETSADSYIVIDELASTIRGDGENFDGDTEVMRYDNYISSSCTINFYGDQARYNANRLMALKRSQLSYELQRDLGFAIYSPSNLVDLRQLTGTQYSERYEATVNIKYVNSQSLNTLRIDTAQIEYLFNE